jgi:hypothetical protein
MLFVSSELVVSTVAKFGKESQVRWTASALWTSLGGDESFFLWTADDLFRLNRNSSSNIFLVLSSFSLPVFTRSFRFFFG